jgi:hypothetical protein
MGMGYKDCEWDSVVSVNTRLQGQIADGPLIAAVMLSDVKEV